ncbi:ABC transporter ATP-binding protein/permease [Ruminococcus albus]|uniref:ABC transporter related protein n=1 Tax=Ruminococcus albus (strain ATCC 27210 / DSM 20455 / JCM 14654 / NCDO 2250 / 7) TaxID=697329 RepID=E6UE75_RUMA7|nr:ABC transporter ATP-binding protein/permease [Ruminococcus albus]ADU22940.1 ABC transporter related protein [Ruminococcus albus 7 = DSM 20455]
MLKIQDIRKEYITGDLKQTALDGVSLNFRDNEFVAILGPSGSGKTTLLNIVGGLDRYDSGDLIINGISTKKYKDRDWDSYRNHTIGFVFQSYNLIPHQSVLSNVELALTISGISKSERKRRAKEALEKVGLGEQIHKRPNQMSGGQMQRVAIARALVNDPDILLADEPTGALDSETSVQVMDLLAEVAKDRLVIMVTHNPELAEQYANRIVKLKDGKMINDSNPYEVDETELASPEHKNMGRSSMSPLTSLGLSFNNLRTKKGRTLLTSFAGSIGIIGIAMILSLSNGVNNYISDVQKSTMASYPISIEAQTFDMSAVIENTPMGRQSEEEKTHDMDGVYVDNSDFEDRAAMTMSLTKNNLTAFKKYLDDKDSEINKYVGENGIVYSYDTKFGVFTYDENGEFVNTDGSTLSSRKATPLEGRDVMGMMGGAYASDFSQLIAGTDGNQVSNAMTENYEVLYGKYPEKYDEVVLVLDENNEVSATVLYELGILPSQEYKDIVDQIDAGKEVKIESKKLDYADICAKDYYLIPQCDLFIKNENGTYDNISDDNTAIEGMIDSAIKLKIAGIIKPNADSDVQLINTPIGYTSALTNYLIDHTNNSEIVKEQLANKDINVINGLSFEAADDKQKIEDAKTYIRSLNTSEKAGIYTTMMQSMDSMSMMSMAGMSMDDLSGIIPEITGEIQKQSNSAKAGESDDAETAENADIPDMPDEMADPENMSEMDMSQLLDEYLESPDDNVMLMIYDMYISNGNYDDTLSTLGVVSLDAPSSIDIYADDFESKDAIAQCIRDYNNKAGAEDQITYTDYVGLMMSSVTKIVNTISYVLIAFVAVSLIVSSIMIGIITYISVLERTKEIGILRAIGASKRNISQVFNAETFIIGLCSGIIGIGLTLLMLIPGNAVIHQVAETDDVNASLPVLSAFVLIALSIFLTLIGGFIPAKKAAKKDPVTALRTE